VLLHGRDNKIGVRREGDRGVRTGPFELDRLSLGSREVQRHAIVAGYAKAHAFRRKGEVLDRAWVLELLHLAVGETHIGTTTRGEGDCALRTSGDAGYPFATKFEKRLHAAVHTDCRHLAILAAGQKSGLGGVGRGDQKAVMRLYCLLAMVQPV